MCVVGVLKETDISFIFFAKIIVFYISFTIRTYRKDDRCACFFTRSFASFYLRLLPVILAFVYLCYVMQLLLNIVLILIPQLSQS